MYFTLMRLPPQNCQKSRNLKRKKEKEKLQQNCVQFSSLLGSCVYKRFQHCPFRFTLVHLVGSLYTSNKNRTIFLWSSSNRQNISANSPLGHYSICCQKRSRPHTFISPTIPIMKLMRSFVIWTCNCPLN